MNKISILIHLLIYSLISLPIFVQGQVSFYDDIYFDGKKETRPKDTITHYDNLPKAATIPLLAIHLEYNRELGIRCLNYQQIRCLSIWRIEQNTRICDNWLSNLISIPACPNRRQAYNPRIYTPPRSSYNNVGSYSSVSRGGASRSSASRGQSRGSSSRGGGSRHR